MEKLTVYYSVSNGGDGSAYPSWFETLELAEMDQELMEEGWGESCTGSISFKGDNISCTDEIMTREKFIEELDQIIRDTYTSKDKVKMATKFKEKLIKQLNKTSKK